MPPLPLEIKEIIKHWSDNELKNAIVERRNVIRYHRNQKSDDRCWLDDYLVWKMLGDSPDEPTTLPPYEKMMQACTDFYNYRRAETPDPLPPDAILDKNKWDDDLIVSGHGGLVEKLKKIQRAIYTHCNIVGRPRNIEDDRKLYSTLPERVSADFRLPPHEDFIGGINPGSGCPNFWKSHQTCPCTAHNIHTWGPCCKKQ